MERGPAGRGRAGAPLSTLAAGAPPRALSVTVRKLEPDARFIAAAFDPASGRREEIGPAKPDADGSWTASPPSGWDGDWVLLLEVPGVKP